MTREPPSTDSVAGVRRALTDQVLGRVQHDLRNAAQLLSGTIGDPDVPDAFQMLTQRVLASMEEQSGRLDWCRRPVDMSRGPVDLLATVRSALTALGLGKPNQQFTLEVNAPLDLPAIDAAESVLVDIMATILVAIRGPSGMLPRRRTAKLMLVAVGTDVWARFTSDALAEETEAEREHRESGLTRAVQFAEAVGATAAELDGAGSGVRLRFAAWQRGGGKESQVA